MFSYRIKTNVIYILTSYYFNPKLHCCVLFKRDLLLLKKKTTWKCEQNNLKKTITKFKGGWIGFHPPVLIDDVQFLCKTNTKIALLEIIELFYWELKVIPVVKFDFPFNKK